MNIRFSHIIFLVATLIFGAAGWRTYHYFFDTHEPSLWIQGLENGAHVAQDVTCTICGSDDYKVGDISISIDGKVVVDRFRIQSRAFEYPFTIATKNLNNGPHTLKAEAVNSTYAQKRCAIEKNFVVDNVPLQGACIRTDNENKVFQGRTLHIQFQVNKEIKSANVHALSHTYPAVREAKNSPIYECYIPISCEEPASEHLARIEIVDHVGNQLWLENKFQVVAFPFKRQQVINVDPVKMQAEREAGLSEKEFELELERLAKESPSEKLWQGSFYAPTDIITISTEYGTIRTSQERGRYMHKAVDITNHPRSVVWATQDGIVVMKNRYAHSGNTVAIDHGCGIFSLFFHLDSFADISVGERIKRGNPIGKIGKTGHATGPHLHWEMRIHNEPVDPMQWIKPNF